MSYLSIDWFFFLPSFLLCSSCLPVFSSAFSPKYSNIQRKRSSFQHHDGVLQLGANDSLFSPFWRLSPPLALSSAFCLHPYCLASLPSLWPYSPCGKGREQTIGSGSKKGTWKTWPTFSFVVALLTLTFFFFFLNQNKRIIQTQLKMIIQVFLFQGTSLKWLTD